MIGPTVYCVHCWHEVDIDASCCVTCGESVSARLPFREALERALESPEQLTARRAAYLLGKLANPASVAALARSIERADPYVAAEAVAALDPIATPEAKALVAAALTHRWVTVRRVAAECLHEGDLDAR